MSGETMACSLTALEQYRRDLQQYPRLTSREEQELLDQARQGHARAKDQIVKACLRYIFAIASESISRCSHTDVLDLVQIGNLTVLESVDRSLEREDPFCFLRKTARMRMLAYCILSDPLIVTPRGAERKLVESLDQSPCDDEEVPFSETIPAPLPASLPVERDYSSLYEALERLPDERRTVLLHRYGLQQHAAESIPDLQRRLYPGVPAQQMQKALRGCEQRALAHLRSLLMKQYYPQASHVPSEYYTLAQVRQLAGVSRDAVYCWVKQGKLTPYPAPAMKRSGHRGSVPRQVYEKSEVERLLRERAKGACLEAVPAHSSCEPAPSSDGLLGLERVCVEVPVEQEVRV